jgi:hypothetical protein
MGRPGLTPKELAKVKVGNDLAAWAVKVIRACLENRVPILLENPQSSFLWRLPDMVDLLQLGLVVNTLDVLE